MGAWEYWGWRGFNESPGFVLGRRDLVFIIDMEWRLRSSRQKLSVRCLVFQVAPRLAMKIAPILEIFNPASSRASDANLKRSLYSRSLIPIVKCFFFGATNLQSESLRTIIYPQSSIISKAQGHRDFIHCVLSKIKAKKKKKPGGKSLIHPFEATYSNLYIIRYIELKLCTLFVSFL